MPDQRSVKWEPVSGIQSACADISFALDARDELTARMHFSFMKGQPARDLLLKFAGVVSVQWEEEAFGMILLPKPWPQIEAGDHPTWTFPLLQIENSAWLADYRQIPAGEGRVHFALVSLNDLLHVLALPEVTVSWVDATSNT